VIGAPVRGVFVALAVAGVVLAARVAPVAAHPLGNYSVNRAVAVEIGTALEVRYLVDMAEIPAFEALQRIDADGDAGVGHAEAATFAGAACADALRALDVAVDGVPAVLREAADPVLDFPPGTGGLETLRLECRFALASPLLDPAREHELTLFDASDEARSGWREVSARAGDGAAIIASDVPLTSPSGLLTAYPEDRLEAPLDLRVAAVRFVLARGSSIGASTVPAATPPPAPERTADPLASLIGGELSPVIAALAVLLSVALGAMHAVSPGHGKTLVAAYVLGAGGSARSALVIGLSVAASHTAGVLVLGIVTLLASEVILAERLIAWLSLASGVVVTGLGTVLLARTLLDRRGHPTTHRHRGALGHAHDHDHQGHHEHHHAHDAAPHRVLGWRSALALGFAGGAVPSTSAVIVLLVAVGTDRLLLGTVLIASFGIGMAVVLGGLALLVGRIGMAAGARGWLAAPLARRAASLVPGIAGAAVVVTGLAFSLAAVGQLA
jgi:nickel/cobalt exporter